MKIFGIGRVNTSKCLKQFHSKASKNQAKTRFVWQNQDTNATGGFVAFFLSK